MLKHLRAAAFLDRDGVLNEAPLRDGMPTSPASLAELRVLAGVAEACSRLKQAGFLLVMVTNQPDIARGKTTAAIVEEINRALQHQLELDHVYVCPHDDADQCDCRKPKPGLLLEAARRWDIDLSASVMVGDRVRDIDAGRAAGCRTVYIDHGYRELPPPHADMSAPSLAAAAPAIIAGDIGRPPNEAAGLPR